MTQSVIQMSPARRLRQRCRHRANWLGISLLMLPILRWVWLAAREPVRSVFNGAVPRYVLSGRLLAERFDTAHAGCVLDQPTIGKWLFWFTVMAGSSLSYAALVRWLSDRTRRGGYLAYAIGVLILSVFLLCLLSWPLTWLIQYVASMGFTPRRVAGLLYAIAGALVVIGFLASACRKPNQLTRKPCRPPDGCKGYASPPR